jgi:hypothetical protein
MVDLSAFKEKTFLQAMQSKGDGIFDKTDQDDNTPVTIAPAEQIVNLLSQFDPKVGQKLFGMFKHGADDLRSVISNIQGQSLSPKQIRGALDPFIAKPPNPNLKDPTRANLALSSIAALSLLGSGSGTLVQIDSRDYLYNVGYEKPNVKSGRSFGVSSTRAALDPSDTLYLGELDDYLKQASDTDGQGFYRAILHILTKCDSSDFGAINPGAQTVGTDFITIYTAELDRHAMVNLDVNKSPWEIDLAEVTFITAYGARSGMVMKNGTLAAGTAKDYYGQGTTGGGIGDTRRDFTKLATLITSFEMDPAHHPDLVQAVVKLTPIQDTAISSQVAGDIFRRYLVYLNRPEFETPIAGNADAFTDSMIALLQQIQADQEQITAYIRTGSSSKSTTSKKSN